MNPVRRLCRLHFLLWTLVALLSGCAHTPGSLPVTPDAGPGRAASVAAGVPLTVNAPVYRVTRGDELVFRFTYTPELNTTAVVRSDGRVSLPLAGDLAVDGLSLPELTQFVQQQLAGQVRRPQVIINVSGTGSQRVFIGGEVLKPGVQPLLGPLSVLQAVMAAEGLRDTAAPSEVLVLRRNGPVGSASEVVKVDVAGLMAGREDARDLLLMPYDVVVVPRSGIAKVNVWVDQYLRRTLPFNMGFNYTISRNGVIQ